MNNTGMVLLSGGLDSVVSLALACEIYEMKLAVTFDYSQRSVKEEIEAASKYAKLLVPGFSDRIYGRIGATMSVT